MALVFDSGVGVFSPGIVIAAFLENVTKILVTGISREDRKGLAKDAKSDGVVLLCGLGVSLAAFAGNN
jgi:hypothetical protein